MSNRLTLLTLLDILVSKKLLTKEEAEDIACVEQVGETLKQGGYYCDEDIKRSKVKYRKVVGLCRGIMEAPEVKGRSKMRDKLTSVIGKDNSFAIKP